ncbi:MAG: hypothetical protein Roseis2KO_44370 [Roseivirga sp.]
MSNVIFSPFYKSHPVFKADQVLSDVHLNDMLQYLEKENAQTRSQLIGSGILAGFDFNTKKKGDVTTLSISDGKGVTSSGQLIIQEYTGGYIHHSNVIEYEAEHLAAEFPNLPDDSIIYALVPDQPDTEEVPEGLTPLTTILERTQDTGLAALQESVDIQVQSCFITSCDERGAQRKFNIKYLLIQAPSYTEEKEDYQSRLQRIKRISFKAVNNPALTETYKEVCSEEHITWLENEIKGIQNHLIPNLKQYAPIPSPNTVGLTLLNKRNALIEAQPAYLPYFYDFLMDLGQTLEEIFRLQKTVNHLLHPLTEEHSRHLMLGRLKGAEATFNRNQFQPVFANQQEQIQLGKLARLCSVLVNMFDTFLAPPKTNDIQATPTCSRKHSITEAAVPFYYSHHKKTRRWNAIGLTDGLADASPLAYYHDDKDALLIEGLPGHSKGKALTALQQIIKDHHLAIGLVALRVSSTDHKQDYPLPKKPKPDHISEYNFKEFHLEHPGLYHASSVPKGGTLAVIFKAEPGNTDGPVVGTLVLPYVCCGRKQAAPEPEPFVLKAVGDQSNVLAGKHLDITILDNDQFDKDSSIEVDFIYDLKATNDQAQVLTDRQTDIKPLRNDLFDRSLPLEVDLIDELEARNVNTKTLTGKSIDIDVLANDTTSPGPIELDFDKDNKK